MLFLIPWLILPRPAGGGRGVGFDARKIFQFKELKAIVRVVLSKSKLVLDTVQKPSILTIMTRSEPDSFHPLLIHDSARLAAAMRSPDSQARIAEFRAALQLQRELLAAEARIHALERLDQLIASDDAAVACRAATAVIRSTSREVAPAPERASQPGSAASAPRDRPCAAAPLPSEPVAASPAHTAFASRFHDLAQAASTPEPLRRTLSAVEDQLLAEIRFVDPLDHPELPFTNAAALAARAGRNTPPPRGRGPGGGLPRAQVA